MVLVWRIMDDLPNFLPTKLSRYTVVSQMKSVRHFYLDVMMIGTLLSGGQVYTMVMESLVTFK